MPFVGTIMLKSILVAVLLLVALLFEADARGGDLGSSTSSTASSTHSRSTKHHAVKSPAWVWRDSNGKIHRDRKQKAAFRRVNPCPSTGKTRGACPGYEVDHRTPLACGGADAPDNMQWLTKKENRSKGSEGCRVR
jgi:5-methylcytosine-specific restriction endonuclease McrA